MATIRKEMTGRKMVILITLILLATSFSLCIGDEDDKGEDEEDVEDDEDTDDNVGTYKVIRIIDGDTFEIEGGKKVRLIGINTPESGQPYYEEATDELKEHILDKEVRLEKDVSDTDQYGRLLRYVYLNDTFVNLEMVKAGLATAYEYEPDTKYSEELKAAEKEAKEARLGMWVPTEVDYDIFIQSFHYDAVGSDDRNLNDEYVVFVNNGSESIVMNEWTVRDDSNNQYKFPDFTLNVNSNVTLHTGSGSDTSEQLYWGKGEPVWNNRGDTLILRDRGGSVVLEYSY